VIRLSKGYKGKRGVTWEKDWISQELKKVEGQDLKRIWVCGSPIMTETFDKAFYDFKKENPSKFAKTVVHWL
jgi:NAD(P)H-flavin reductase